MSKILFILLILTLLQSVTFAQSDATYIIKSKSKENTELQSLLLRFDSLLRAKKSVDAGPKLGEVKVDVGCTISLTKKNGSDYSIYFNEVMKIDGTKIKLKKVDEVYPELIRKQDSTHTFYLANSYLIDIETISDVKKLDSGTGEDVIIRIGSKAGITVIKGYKYCGC